MIGQGLRDAIVHHIHVVDIVIGNSQLRLQ